VEVDWSLAGLRLLLHKFSAGGAADRVVAVTGVVVFVAGMIAVGVVLSGVVDLVVGVEVGFFGSWCSEGGSLSVLF